MRGNKGITLIALIITIIVLIILVAVTVTFALQGGLFTNAKEAAKKTEPQAIYETILSELSFTQDGNVNVKETAVGAKKAIEQEKTKEGNPVRPTVISPDPLPDNAEKATLTVTGKYGTYEYEITGKGVESKKETDDDIIDDVPFDLEKYILGADKTGRLLIYNSEDSTEENTEFSIMNEEFQFQDDPETEINESEKVTLVKMIAAYSYPSNVLEDESYEEVNYYTEMKQWMIFYIRYNDDGKLYKFEADNIMDIDWENERARMYYQTRPLSQSEKIRAISTTNTDVGKTTMVNGEKYIVLYGPGEKGSKAQLISAKAFGDYGLNHSNSSVNWSQFENDSRVDLYDDTKSTATSKLSNVEKNIYLFNNAVEMLNNNCYELVKNDFGGITKSDVRCVGSNPTNPNDESTLYYSSPFLASIPSRDPDYDRGVFDGKLKKPDQNYIEDFERMLLIGIDQAENSKQYWLASRAIWDIAMGDAGTTAGIYISYTSESADIFTAEGSLHVFYDSEVYANGGATYGIRPVVSVNLSDYTLSN